MDANDLIKARKKKWDKLPDGISDDDDDSNGEDTIKDSHASRDYDSKNMLHNEISNEKELNPDNQSNFTASVFQQVKPDENGNYNAE